MYHRNTDWGSKWITIAREQFGFSSSARNDWRTTEAMEVPDGVILMTTIVTVGSSGSSSSINTMFIPKMKIQGNNLVPV
jgi:hypothetical protein